jgi:segregation and condensation protein B
MPEQEAKWQVDAPIEESVPPQPAASAAVGVAHPTAPASFQGTSAGLFSAPPPPTTPPPLPRLVEAMLFAAPHPLTAAQAAESIRGLTAEQFQQVIHSLQQDYRTQGRPYGIQRKGDGYRLTIRPTFQFLVHRLYGGIKEARLSPGVVETLAVVAYKQPVSKTETDALRGQDSGPMLRQLLRRGLIAVKGKADDGKGEVLFVTPPRFLEFFHLASLDDLPRVDDLPYL